MEEMRPQAARNGMEDRPMLRAQRIYLQQRKVKKEVQEGVREVKQTLISE